MWEEPCPRNTVRMLGVQLCVVRAALVGQGPSFAPGNAQASTAPHFLTFSHYHLNNTCFLGQTTLGVTSFVVQRSVDTR